MSLPLQPILIGVTTAVGMQSFRAVWPHVMREGAAGMSAMPLVFLLIALIAAAVAAWLLERTRSNFAVPVLAGISAVLALVIVLVTGVSLGLTLLIFAANVALLGLLVPKVTPSVFVSGVSVGLAFDLGIRAMSATWDPIWQTGLTGVLGFALLAVTAVPLALLTLREPNAEGNDRATSLIVVPVWLGLVVLFLGNFGVVSAATGWRLLDVTVVVLLALTLAFLVPDSSLNTRGVALVSTAALALSVIFVWFTLPGVTPVATVVGIPAATALMRIATTPKRVAWLVSPTLSLGAGFLLVSLVVLLVGAIGAVAWLLAVGALAWAALRTESDVGLSVRPALYLAVPLVVAAPIVLLISKADSPEPTSQIRLVSLNMSQGVGAINTQRSTASIDLHQTFVTIQQFQPTVIALQDVGRGSAASGFTDDYSWLEHSLGFGGTAAPSAGGASNAIFSAVTFTDATSFDVGGGLPAGAAVTLQQNEGPALLTSVALTPGETEGQIATRDAQVTALLNFSDGVEAAIVAGSLNGDSASPPLQRLVQAGYLDNSDTIVLEGERTFVTYQGNDRNRAQQADYIVVKGPLELTKRMIGLSRAAAHRPIFAIVESTIAPAPAPAPTEPAQSASPAPEPSVSAEPSPTQ